MYLAQHSQVLFKAFRVTQLRRKSIGYTNHCACLVGVPSMSSEQARHIAHRLVELRHTFTRNSEQLFRQGLLQLQPRKFSFRGAAPDNWSHAGDTFPRHNAEQVDVWLQSMRPTDTPVATSLRLRCPVCNSVKDCINQFLLKGHNLVFHCLS